jgi:imidazolonepropionase-like amidohydrolase
VLIRVEGRTIIPGLVNAHGHVGDTRGLETGPQFYTEESVGDQLLLYARYGVTTVVSLGGDGEAGFRAHDEQQGPVERARIFPSGPVVTAADAAAARKAVADLAAQRPAFVKIRVDDNLGTGQKMKPEVFGAVIDEAHRRGLRVAAHIFYLDDAKALLRAGVDFLAHSIRDRDVDAELIALMKKRDVCLSPTLMREVSTFVYESRPAFFDDPFFRRYADEATLKQLEDPSRQAKMRESAAAKAYRRALDVAARNVKALSAAGIRLASGTDTGPPARFQGYFEHLELERLVGAGLTPAQALLAGTRDAAACTGLGDRVGTLAPGRWADFVVLSRNPLTDIRNTRAVHSVWMGGRRVPR